MDPLLDLALPGLIHDLNNVFQALMDAADSLSGDTRWAHLSAAIFRSVERGREITQSMQAIDQPSAPFETVLKNARTLVEDSMISRPGPKIRFDCRTEPDLVLRHAWAWERVLINLFCNAVQAMPDGGTIFSGIAPELLAVVFDPRVSTKTLGGLGLHVVHSIVKQEAGEVRAANRDGCGAEFTITLPAQPVITRVVGA